MVYEICFANTLGTMSKVKSALVQLSDVWFTRSGGSIFSTKNNYLKPTNNNNGDIRPVFSSSINYTLNPKSRVAVIGDYPKTDFLSVLTNKFISHPINSRTYPSSLNDPFFKTELLRFVNNGSWGHGAHDSTGGFTHLSSRYEFFKDYEIDEIVENFISNQSYNSNIEFNKDKINYLIKNLNLVGLQGQFLTTLSNGQFRRARIAKSLYSEPSLLCIDDPFLGLDPVATKTVDNILMKTSHDENIKTTIVIGLRNQDDIPEWIDEVVIVNETGIVKSGRRLDLLDDLNSLKRNFNEKHKILEDRISKNMGKIKKLEQNNLIESTESVVEMNNTTVSYKNKPIIKDLTWNVKNGEKWHIRGRNGSGKTTLLSLITLDHPQSWNKSIKVFGIERSPGKVNYFDTNKFIGFTSPELHALYPKKHTVFQTISTGYIVGSYIPPTIEELGNEKVNRISQFLKLIEIDNLKDFKFGEIHVSKQKLVLLIRSIINNPKILILDEALSAMTDEDLIKGKCLIDQLNTTCLIIGHVENEIPKCNKYILVNDAKRGKYEIGDV